MAESEEMSVAAEGDNNKESDSIDPYAYTKTDVFTSEVFKVEIQNLPKFFGIKQLKKKLGHISVYPCKVKMAERASYAFVNFRSEEEREAALKAIVGQVWKNKNITAKKARPAADPALLKRKQEAEKDESGPGRKKARQEDTRTEEERLRDAVTPLWRKDYKDQLAQKEQSVRDYLVNLGREMEKQNHSLKHRHAQQRKLHNCCCELVPIKQSPVLTRYRNKCEFTVGQTVDGVDKAVGFRLGSYKEGKIHVANPNGCEIAPHNMIQVAQVMQDYCQQCSELPGFDPVRKSGAWRQVTARHTLDGGVMVILVLYREGIAQEVIDNEKKKLSEFLQSKDLPSLFVKVSLYLEIVGNDRKVPSELIHLGGETQLYEQLLGLSFRISPAAFFQVNTRAAEVLYSTVGEWADLSENTVLLDVCCGTGTIGLTLAKKVKKVIGIEMCKEAVEDAKFNANLNNIDNVEFHCGKAEDVLPRLLKRYHTEDVVAVVDPPRGGLHPDVVIAIRGSSFIKRLVYVSCSPAGAKNNIIYLTRKPSRRVGGAEFHLIQAVPVDLFPLTPHYELVMLFTRSQSPNTDKKQSETTATVVKGDTNEEKDTAQVVKNESVDEMETSQVAKNETDAEKEFLQVVKNETNGEKDTTQKMKTETDEEMETTQVVKSETDGEEKTSLSNEMTIKSTEELAVKDESDLEQLTTMKSETNNDTELKK